MKGDTSEERMRPDVHVQLANEPRRIVRMVSSTRSGQDFIVLNCNSENGLSLDVIVIDIPLRIRVIEVAAHSWSPI